MGLTAALGFLTVVGPARAPTPAALRWFPIVGVAVGAVVAAAWWGAGELWSPLLVGVAVVAVDLVVTGCLHVDGLADVADGLLPPLPRPRRLAVMADPDVGAFGVAAVTTVLVARVAAFASVPTSAPVLAGVVAAWAVARGAMALAVATQPYARGSGLATAFGPRPTDGATGPERGEGGTAGSPVHPSRRGDVVVVTAVTLGVVAVATAVGGWRPVGAATVAAAAFAAVVALGRRRLGGYTGDVLGAAGVLAETAALVVLATRS